MSVALGGRRRPAWTSGLARHASPPVDRTPSFRIAFRVALVVILLVAAFHKPLATAAGLIFLSYVIAALYGADLIGIQ